MYKQFLLLSLFCFSLKSSEPSIEQEIFNSLCNKEEEAAITLMKEHPNFNPHYSALRPAGTIKYQDGTAHWEMTLLGVTAYHNLIKAGRRLVKKDASTTTCGKSVINGLGELLINSPLFIATHYGHHKFMQMLIARGANTQDPQTLIRACQRRDPVALRILLRAEANPNIAIKEIFGDSADQHDLYTMTPLMAAVITKSPLCVKLLLKAKANSMSACLGYCDSAGRAVTPLYKACQSPQNTESVRALLAAGADPKEGVLEYRFFEEENAPSNEFKTSCNYKVTKVNRDPHTQPVPLIFRTFHLLKSPLQQAKSNSNGNEATIRMLCEALGEDPEEHLPKAHNPWQGFAAFVGGPI